MKKDKSFTVKDIDRIEKAFINIGVKSRVAKILTAQLVRDARRKPFWIV